VIRGGLVPVAALLVPLICGNPVIAQEGPAKEDKPAPQEKPGQPPAKEKPAPVKPDKAAVPSLEEMLTQALKANPDILVAETKMREAEANLNRTRLQVTQKAVALHQNLKSQQAQVENAEAQYKQAELNLDHATLLYKKGTTTNREGVDEAQRSLNAARADLVAVKAALAQTEAELPYLLGKYPQAATSDLKTEQARLLYLRALSLAQMEFDNVFHSETPKGKPAASPPLPTAMAEKIRKALNAPVVLNFDRTPLSEVLAVLGDKTGISFYIKGDNVATADLRLLDGKEAVPLAAALQAIGDLLPGVQFAVRDYGILVARSDDIPSGAVLVENFWKAEKAKEKIAAPPKLDKPAPGNAPAPKSSPPGEVKGTIQDVDRRSGLVSLSLGSDAGLQVGDTLEVYRLKPKPVFIGTVRVVDVAPRRAVARPITSFSAGSIQQGDQVADRILSRR
jgi:hypothetical protein